MNDWNIEKWLSDSEIAEIEYSDYWNDEEKEKNKEWYILDGDFTKMEQYLQKNRLAQSLQQCIEALKNDFKRQFEGVGLDLAAGNLWAARYLFDLGVIEKLYCVEYSKHRLLRIGPKVLDYYNIPKERVVLVQGSFYNLHLPEKSVDFVFMSQAFHHADNPVKLMEEVRRVLKPNGIVIIIGEHIVAYRIKYIKHAIKFIISGFPEYLQEFLFGNTFNVKTLIAKTNEVLPPNPVLGDHFYTDRAYKHMFSQHGFKIRHFKNHNSRFQSFLLVGNGA
ncbi:class I SAM-dependent methyltransferase [candidate division KSB1 bacterium]|nr:class I SAM-dependent methyltransferase [candidate division KSB1 bacterium]